MLTMHARANDKPLAAPAIIWPEELPSMNSPYQIKHDTPATLTHGVDTAVLEVDEATLLANPDVLRRAMVSAMRSDNTAGIVVLLPVYEKSANPDPVLLQYARAIHARLQGRHNTAVQHYTQLLAQVPDAHGVRMQLAETLADNYQHKAAAEQLNLLQNAELDSGLQKRYAGLHQRLQARDQWRFHAAVQLLTEDNINNAPALRRAGNWTFDAPLRDRGLGYQVALEKKWPLLHGAFYALGITTEGRQYARHSRYSNFTTQLAPGIGVARQGKSLSFSPFIQYRWFGGSAYSQSMGAQVQWHEAWSSRWQTRTLAEYSRQRHRERQHLDHTSFLAGLSLAYQPGAGYYWQIGHELYAKTDTRDSNDRFHQASLRAQWERHWPSGLGTVVIANTGTRLYNGPTLFSQGLRRRDTLHGISLSLWHQRINHSGLTPRLTWSHQRVRSNDMLFAAEKSRVFIEANKYF
ncbi:porin family protein [Pusillimonas sp. ANT_WB101]|uniref:porin family protein n=1 Tax=Pusillimonas sp. ANT_WB101 TaxID=2597356 RepID=UPI00165D4FE5|nr:porin family protein [Pusillimonas sp. ANT_WB101]